MTNLKANKQKLKTFKGQPSAWDEVRRLLRVEKAWGFGSAVQTRDNGLGWIRVLIANKCFDVYYKVKSK